MFWLWAPFPPFNTVRNTFRNPFRPPQSRQARLRELERRMSEFIAAKRGQTDNPVLTHVASERERVRHAIAKARGEFNGKVSGKARGKTPLPQA